MTRRGALLFAGLCLAWGIPYLLIKIAVTELSPAVLVFARTGLAAAFLLPLALAKGVIGPALRRWKIVLVFTVIEIGVPWLLLSHAEQHLTSSVTGLLIAAVPIVGALIALGTGNRDRLGPLTGVGMLVGLLGVAAVLGLDTQGTRPLAVAELAVVAIGYAIGPVIMDRQLSDVPSLGVLTTSLGMCALGYLPFALFTLPPRLPSGRVVTAVALLALVCTVAAFLMMFALVAEVGPVRSTLITYVNPAVAVAAGVLLLDEPLTMPMVLGFALVIVGSVLAGRRRGGAEESASGGGERSATHPDPEPDAARKGGVRGEVSRR